MRELVDILQVVCTVVGALTLWVLVTGAVASLVIKQVKRRRSATVRAGRSRSRRPQGARPRVERRAQTWDDVPSWVARDRRWAVAVVLLGSPEIAARTHDYVDFSARRINWAGLLAAASSWPRRERLLVAVAHDLAGEVRSAPTGASPGPRGRLSSARTLGDSSTPVADPVAAEPAELDDPVSVAELVTDLDEYALDRVHTALDLRRGTVSYDEAVKRSGGLG